MNQWLPVIATLSGAIVAGSISFVVHWLTNKNSLQLAKLQLAEERARWATERHLDRVQNCYGKLETLIAATDQLRLNWAWKVIKEEEGEDPPPWVPSYNDARGGFETAMHEMNLQMGFMDEDIQEKFKKAKASELKWMTARTYTIGRDQLAQLGTDLYQFQIWLAGAYRKAFHDRRLGNDC